MSQLEQFMSAEPLPPSHNRKTWGRRIAALVVLGIALVLVASAVVFLRPTSQPDNDYSGSGAGTAVVIVSRGDTLTQIGRTLEQAGVVKSAQAFIDAAGADDRSTTIGPGKYTLRNEMSGSAAVELMLDPTSRADSRLVLPEGLRLEQTVEAASEATGLPKADFQKALRNPHDLGLPAWAKDRPEGFMFPATYDLAGDETAKALLKALVKRFDQTSNDVGIERRASEVGLSPYEVLIVASLLQAEARPQDFEKVARVIYNRLDQGMRLQLDATVAYALGLTTLQLTDEQLKTKSPYNTYLRAGLPPRPINSPGEAAIEAALSPAKGPWVYYVTVDPTTGETKFTKSYDKFLQYKAELQRNLAAASPAASSGKGNG